MPGLNGSPASAVKISWSALGVSCWKPCGIQQQLRRGVVVLLEDRVDLVEQGLHRLRLGLGGGARPAVRLGRRIGRRAVVVAAPVRREVAIGVHAVAGRDHAVAIVVAQVLAPQAVAGRERVLVAVGVVDADEPQLRAVDEARHLEAGARALAVVVDEVVQRAPARLAGQPLAGVLHRVVEDRGTPGDVRPRGALGDLQGDDVAPVVGRRRRRAASRSRGSRRGCARTARCTAPCRRRRPRRTSSRRRRRRRWRRPWPWQGDARDGARWR